MNHAGHTTQSEPPPSFPRWVRWMAAFYYLSMILGPLVFFVLMGVAFYFAMKRKEFDGTVLSLGAAALACPLVMGCFRAWFAAWGRRRYGDPSGLAEQRSEP